MQSIRSGEQPLRTDFDNQALSAIEARVNYHGIAGLLTERGVDRWNWPDPLKTAIRDKAVSRSMWELRHRAILASLTEAFGSAGIPALLLKGTAVAYDLYLRPASRERGDTDLLVEPRNRVRAGAILAELGFEPVETDDGMPDDLRAQESWKCRIADGSEHCVDLHWQLINSPALDDLLCFADLAKGARTLTALGESAKAPSRPMMLFHALLHRQSHEVAPYFVDGISYVSGDRLVWLYDIALLSDHLSVPEWRAFRDTAIETRMAQPCLEGLAAARPLMTCGLPEFVGSALERSGAKSHSYYRSGRLGRALSDFAAVAGGHDKWRYLKAKLFPAEAFMRAKYPDLAKAPLHSLYGRRFASLFRPRQKTPGR